MGRLAVRMPYHIQNRTPIEKMMYIGKERSLACLVRLTFITCGKKDIVVQNAPILPINVIASSIVSLHGICFGTVSVRSHILYKLRGDPDHDVIRIIRAGEIALKCFVPAPLPRRGIT